MPAPAILTAALLFAAASCARAPEPVVVHPNSGATAAGEVSVTLCWTGAETELLSSSVLRYYAEQELRDVMVHLSAGSETTVRTSADCDLLAAARPCATRSGAIFCDGELLVTSALQARVNAAYLHLASLGLDVSLIDVDERRFDLRETVLASLRAATVLPIAPRRDAYADLTLDQFRSLISTNALLHARVLEGAYGSRESAGFIEHASRLRFLDGMTMLEFLENSEVLRAYRTTTAVGTVAVQRALTFVIGHEMAHATGSCAGDDLAALTDQGLYRADDFDLLSRFSAAPVAHAEFAADVCAMALLAATAETPIEHGALGHPIDMDHVARTAAADVVLRMFGTVGSCRPNSTPPHPFTNSVWRKAMFLHAMSVGGRFSFGENNGAPREVELWPSERDILECEVRALGFRTVAESPIGSLFQSRGRPDRD